MSRVDASDGDREVLLTPERVSEILAIPVATLYRWRLTGYGPKAIKVGKHLRWRVGTVDVWLNDQESDA